MKTTDPSLKLMDPSFFTGSSPVDNPEENSQASSNGKSKPERVVHPLENSPDLPPLTDIQVFITEAIVNEPTGSVSLDEIYQYVSKRWRNIKRRDGSNYTTDCRRAIQANLRHNPNHLALFRKDKTREGYWKLCLTPEDAIEAARERQLEKTEKEKEKERRGLDTKKPRVNGKEDRSLEEEMNVKEEERDLRPNRNRYMIQTPVSGNLDEEIPIYTSGKNKPENPLETNHENNAVPQDEEIVDTKQEGDEDEEDDDIVDEDDDDDEQYQQSRSRYARRRASRRNREEAEPMDDQEEELVDDNSNEEKHEANEEEKRISAHSRRRKKNKVVNTENESNPNEDKAEVQDQPTEENQEKPEEIAPKSHRARVRSSDSLNSLIQSDEPGKLTELQEMICDCITANAGSCHFELIVHHVHKNWDKAKNGVIDYKEAILRALTGSRGLFKRDARTGWWTIARAQVENKEDVISPSRRKIRRKEKELGSGTNSEDNNIAEDNRTEDEIRDRNDLPMTDLQMLIIEAIHLNGGIATFDQLYDHINKQFDKLVKRDGMPYTSDCKRAIQASLSNNPTFRPFFKKEIKNGLTYWGLAKRSLEWLDERNKGEKEKVLEENDKEEEITDEISDGEQDDKQQSEEDVQRSERHLYANRMKRARKIKENAMQMLRADDPMNEEEEAARGEKNNIRKRRKL